MGKTYVSYVPHGIDSQIFKPIDKENENFLKFKKDTLGDNEYKFIVFYNSRNIRRKCTSNIMLGFKFFVNQLPVQERDKVLLLLHTTPVDNAGTNLMEVHNRLLPQCRVILIPNGYTPQQMNYLYNLSDVTCAASSAQGFGLSSAQSIMAGTMVISTLTGGLQDQMRLKFKDKLYYNSIDHPSCQDGNIQEHGE